MVRLAVILALALADAASAAWVSATGGVVTDIPGYRMHVFTNSGTFSVSDGGDVEVLLVGGGGGGGMNGGGGGGAGGLICSNVFPVIASNYTVTVGGGGGLKTPYDSNWTTSNGADSVFGSLIAKGGGGGSSRDYGPQGATGGSGGGGGGATASPRYIAGNGTTGQGNNGGNGVFPDSGVNSAGGGGGGAGGPGIAGAYQQGGNGGIGLQFTNFATVAGSPAGWFAGGGAGGKVVNGSNGVGGTNGGGGNVGVAGITNTGGGGGAGAAGGSGIVIVRYPVSVDAPGVDNANGATNVIATSACLNGYLSSTGTSATTAFVYWGETDGETNQWANTNTFVAPQTVGPLTTNVTLQTGKEYFYRYAASNDSGLVWANTSEYLLSAGITVSVNPDAVGESKDTATFSFARAQSVTSRAVTVFYAINGDAINGADYETLASNITINAGDTNVTVQVTTIPDVPMESDEALELIVLGGRNYAVGTPSNAVLTITNEVLVASVGSGYWDLGTTWVGGSVPTGSDDVTITNGCTVTIRTNTAITVKSLTIRANGVLTHTNNSTTALGERYKVVLSVSDDLTIDLDGQINVNGKGYSRDHGPGGSGFGYGTGGSHGGRGGLYYTSWARQTYGSITAPTNCGSGGGSGYVSEGGGAVILTVNGETTVNGVISAHGLNVSQGGGAGGSIFLTTGTLTGNGILRANGGTGGPRGGGGRIAVILTNDTGFGAVTMQAYAGGADAAAGTVYTETPSQGSGKGILLIDANNIASANAAINTLISSNVTDTIVGTVVITNKAILGINTNQSLTVNGSWTNAASFVASLDSTVLFAGASAATVKGHNTFYNLVCTNAGKAIAFEDGKTNAVDGTLTLANVTLDSTSGSASWYLKASVSIHSVSNVTVGRSDARPGSTIEAYDSTDLGGNFKWVFAESGFNTNLWTGATDSDWDKTNNWSLNRSTILTDTVVIPGGCPNDPLLDAHKRMLSLVVSNGASMGLAGYNLTVDEATTVAGALTAMGSETLTLGGDLDFSGGVFTAAVSTVLLSGSNAQSVVSAGNAFHLLTISNSAATVSFADAVTATNIVNLGTPVTFGGSMTVASAFRTREANVTFVGAVTASSFHNASGALVFSDTMTATSFYSESGALVFTGVVATATFTNWHGDLTFHDDFSSDEFFCAPGGMDLTFEAGKMYAIGDFAMYGRGGNPIRMRSSAAAYWNLKVTNRANVRLVDVQYSDASEGLTIRPLSSTDSGFNLNWEFDPSWQTWVGGSSASFTNGSNWDPAVAPGESRRLLVDGYYTTAPILSGVATAAQLTVGGGVTTATLEVNGQLTILENVEVQARGTLSHSANTSTEANKITLAVVSNLTIHVGGQISVDGKGYLGGNGPGKAVGSYAGGAGHGGRGGQHDPGTPGTTYGSVTTPTNCGSGGLNASGSTGRGGGAARLVVSGTTTVHGAISADGVAAYCSGSGGSVFLTTATLLGNGVIRANGGTASAGGGGGGRIAVVLTNATDFGEIGFEAVGGGTTKAGAAGTIYLAHADQAPGCGTLIIDNANKNPAAPYPVTLINSQVTDTVVGTVVITNKARFWVDTNQSLTVNGSWTNAATFMANSNSTVIFTSTNTATIMGNNAFYNLTAGAAGKTIRFEAGKTNAVNGTLVFQKDTTLLSMQDGVQWWLNLSSSTGTQNVGRVMVKDSNASPGQQIRAGAGSRDLRNNVNWWFPPAGAVFVIH